MTLKKILTSGERGETAIIRAPAHRGGAAPSQASSSMAKKARTHYKSLDSESSVEGRPMAAGGRSMKRAILTTALLLALPVGVAAQSAPDLVVLGANVSDSSPETGGTFWLIATVTNQGDGESAATTVRYYRSTDSTITASATLKGTDAVRALVPPQGYGATILLMAPSMAGRYYYYACVDAVAGESDTTNNCSSSVQVTVSAPPPGGGGGPRQTVPGAPTNLRVEGGDG